jgi:integrase
LRRFTTDLVEQHQTDLINQNLKPATVNRNLSVLKAMIRKAVDWNMAQEEILKQVRRVKNLPENNERLRFLSKDEFTRLIGACEERNKNDKRVKHLKPVIITALNTGMRKEEVLSLKWDRVDLNHNLIMLNKMKNGERREIPINDVLKDTLEALPRHINSEYVFCNQKTVKRYGNIKRSFATVCKRAKLLDFHFHDMRHTCASNLVMAGVDITTVSRLLGHKDIKMTLRYSHLAPAHMRSAVDKLNSALLDNHGSIQKLDSLADGEITHPEKSLKINRAPLAQVDRAQVS